MPRLANMKNRQQIKYQNSSTLSALQEFTVTDDTVLEEHLENPDLVQMRILGEGGK